MTFNPGRNAGRVSIRVVPDTTRFRRDLKRSLDIEERRTSFTVNVTKAKLDKAKIRADIARQMRGLKDISVEVDVRTNVIDAAAEELRRADSNLRIKPTMDLLTLKRLRNEMQKSLGTIEADLSATINDRRLRQQLDHLSAAFDRVGGKLASNILSPEEAEKLRVRLNEIKRKVEEIAESRTVRFDANAFTAFASRQLAWVSRTRFVDLVVRVSKKSIADVTATLAALSGARLTWKWIDDFLQQMKELDRNLPSLLGWTTGITSLVASLFAATSGLVGIGQGLFSILPAFLVLPGLFLNALGSVTALIVALKNSGTELAVLKDDMHELGDIINETFWGRARQPIIDLVQRLMPQLRNAFRDLSAGIGDFAGAMANSFGKELANGRLESIFNGIADGWRVLASGADGFAGALVSLSNIASQYTPRLAGWFVRQANAFDKWLKATSEDGRLSGWIETSIDSMYDLWDATVGVAGIFEGLWNAADAAGSTGLNGFAKMMLQWKEIVNGADFQRGLTAVFRGSYTAMEAFGDAIKAIGGLFVDLDKEFERFIGSAGQFFGGIIEAAFVALSNSPEFARGLTGLSLGLDLGLEKIAPTLQPIADTFGNFLGLVGDLASTILPAAAGAFSDLMPAVDSLIGTVEDILPDLAATVTKIADELGPIFKDFIDKVGPTLGDALVSVAEILADLVPLIGDVLSMIADLVGFVSTDTGASQTDQTGANITKFFTPDYNDWIVDLEAAFGSTELKINPTLVKPSEEAIRQSVEQIKAAYDVKVNDEGKATADSWLEGIAAVNMPGAVKNELLQVFGPEYLPLFFTNGVSGGGGLSRGLAQGIGQNRPAVVGAASGLGSSAAQAARTAGNLYGIGLALADGMAAGIRDRAWAVGQQAGALVRNALAAARAAGDINSPSRKARKELGWNVGDGFALGLSDRRARVEAASRRLMGAAFVDAPTRKGGDDPTAVLGNRTVNVNLYSPTVRDVQSSMAEAADMAGVML